MKKVNTPQQVCHLFANQLQTEARTQTSNLFFDNENLYSYGRHFCIARFVDTDTLLFTERGYSNTTAKHIGWARHATNHITKIYCAYPTGAHSQNFAYWEQAAEEQLSKLKNARKQELYLNELLRIKDKATKYAEYFKIRIPLTLETILSITDKSEVIDYLESRQKIIDQEKAELEAINLAKHKEELNLWRSFEKQKMYLRDGFDYLRADKDKFETSQGVSIPLNVGLIFYKNIKQSKVDDTFLDFKINEITNEYISIGCHRITFEEINSTVNSLTNH